jgi:hypothetical protein
VNVLGVVTLAAQEKVPEETIHGPFEVVIVNPSTVPLMCIVASVCVDHVPRLSTPPTKVPAEVTASK